MGIKRTTITTREKRQRLFLCLFGMILLGVVSSVLRLLCNSQSTIPTWTGLAGDFLQARQDGMALFLEGFSGTVLFLLAFFWLGFSAVGQPFSLLILCTYGFCMGSVLLTAGMCGGFLPILCLLPNEGAVSFLLTVAARESLRFSGSFTGYGFRDEPVEQMAHQTRLYCIRFLVLIVLLFLWAILYGLGFYVIRMIWNF